jgi:hypothetical protein
MFFVFIGEKEMAFSEKITASTPKAYIRTVFTGTVKLRQNSSYIIKNKNKIT